MLCHSVTIQPRRKQFQSKHKMQLRADPSRPGGRFIAGTPSWRCISRILQALYELTYSNLQQTYSKPNQYQWTVHQWLFNDYEIGCIQCFQSDDWPFFTLVFGIWWNYFRVWAGAFLPFQDHQLDRLCEKWTKVMLCLDVACRFEGDCGVEREEWKEIMSYIDLTVCATYHKSVL